MRRLVLIAWLACWFSTGCLSDMHRIPRNELFALSQKPPNERNLRVRVVQGLPGEEEPPAPAPAYSHTSVFVGGAVGGGFGPVYRTNKLAEAKADEGKAWLIIAGAVAAGLALSEGLRYDGWVELGPDHPVHLFGPFGQYTWMPLSQLDPETAAWAHKALIRPTEGPFKELQRAPLDRVGFTYSFLLGSAEIPSAAERALNPRADTGEPGFIGHIQIGYFPLQALGVLLDFGLGYRRNTLGDTVYEGRNALELQLLPFSAGALHAGIYGDIGAAVRLEDGARGKDKNAFLGGAGGLVQIELTTRLTLTGRAGLTYLFGERTAEAAIGVSIY